MKKSFKEILAEARLETSIFDESADRRFDVQHLDATEKFLVALDPKCRHKIDITIEYAQKQIDREVLKKLTKDIWEFRIKHQGSQYRLLAFWARDDVRRLLLTTHGFLKKTNKVPLKELQRADEIRARYLDNKN